MARHNQHEHPEASQSRMLGKPRFWERGERRKNKKIEREAIRHYTAIASLISNEPCSLHGNNGCMTAVCANCGVCFYAHTCYRDNEET